MRADGENNKAPSHLTELSLGMPAPKHQEINVTAPVRQWQDVLAFVFCVGCPLALWAEVFSRIPQAILRGYS